MLATHEPCAGQSAWSDDEEDVAHDAMNEWVDEVHQFLGGSPRTADKSEPKAGAWTGARAKPLRRLNALFSVPLTPRLGMATPKLSPTDSVSPVSDRSAPVFRPYIPVPPVSPLSPLSPSVWSRASMPLRTPPPRTALPLLPVRPYPDDVPVDVCSDDDDTACLVPELPHNGRRSPARFYVEAKASEFHRNPVAARVRLR